MNSAPITTDGPEWFLDSLYRGIEGIRSVQWRHADGESAVHYYSDNLELIAAGFGNLPPAERYRLAECCIPSFAKVWSDLICGVGEHEINFPAEFHHIGPNAREDVARHLWPIMQQACREVELDKVPREEWPGMPLPFDLVERALQEDFLSCQIEALRSGRLLLAGDGGLPSKSGIFLHSSRFVPVHAYRFISVEHREVIYLVCTDWNYQPHCLYFPKRNLTVFPNGQRRANLLGQMRKPVDRALFEAVAKHADLLSTYLPLGNQSLGVFSFYRHIGHHLWNELTGLDALDATDWPVYSVGSTNSEMYGPLEELFPQCSRLIDRTVQNLWDLPPVVYARRIGFIHPTGEKITRRLQGRIITAAGRAEVQTQHDTFVALREHGYRIVVLGLRVENRTLEDLPEFFCTVIETLIDAVSAVAVVVDGHNVSWQTRGPYQTIGNSMGLIRSEQAEFATLARLEAAFANEPRVKIISTLGQPVANSIFWCSRADFFVTPWGAGLAKYRWVCNLPGVIVSSQYFLAHPESWLYDDHRYVEDPAATFRILPEDATDLPEAPQIVPMPGESRSNFRVDMEAVRRQIGAAVTHTSGRLPAATEAEIR